MNNLPLVRVAAVFSFLSPLCILAGVPVAAGLRGVGGPGPIDFGNAELLTLLAVAAPRTVWIDAIALVSPVLALPVGVGWYIMLRQQKTFAVLGTLLWYLGMVFIIAQDALQVALVATLPSAYVVAEQSVQAALVAFGDSFANIIDVLAMVGAVSYIGSGVLSFAMMHSRHFPKWIAILGLLSSALPVFSLCSRLAFPNVPWLQLGLPIGVLAFIVLFIPAAGLLMLRWKGESVAASSA